MAKMVGILEHELRNFEAHPVFGQVGRGLIVIPRIQNCNPHFCSYIIVVHFCMQVKVAGVPASLDMACSTRKRGPSPNQPECDSETPRASMAARRMV